jgi:hypothetical protein
MGKLANSTLVMTSEKEDKDKSAVFLSVRSNANLLKTVALSASRGNNRFSATV